MRGSREHYELLTQAFQRARMLIGDNFHGGSPRKNAIAGMEVAARQIAAGLERDIPSFDRERFLKDAGCGPHATAAHAGQQREQ